MNSYDFNNSIGVEKSGKRALRRGRVSVANHVYAVTTVTVNRVPLFQRFELGRLVVREIRNLHEAGVVDSMAYVVMPDHMHWLFQLSAEHSLSAVIRLLKGRSAIAVNRVSGRKGPVWQAGFHDHGIRMDEDLRMLARYIVGNPVRAGLVAQPGEYPLWDAIWL